MGLVKNGALSSTINRNNALLWKVPQNWSLKQAATIPYSFFVVKKYNKIILMEYNYLMILL